MGFSVDTSCPRRNNTPVTGGCRIVLRRPLLFRSSATVIVFVFSPFFSSEGGCFVVAAFFVFLLVCSFRSSPRAGCSVVQILVVVQ